MHGGELSETYDNGLSETYNNVARFDIPTETPMKILTDS